MAVRVLFYYLMDRMRRPRIPQDPDLVPRAAAVTARPVRVHGSSAPDRRGAPADR